MEPFNYRRRFSSIVSIGDTHLGGKHPIRIQSMATVPTMDTDSAVNQAIRMINAGADYVRFTAQSEREAYNLQTIRQSLTKRGFMTPLVADIHFNSKVADKAALFVEKVRINPGNYAAYDSKNMRKRFVQLLKICRENNTAIRIGVNHGSLSERIINQYGDTPEGMAESCLEFLRICKEMNFNNVVVSMKASNTIVMINAVRFLVHAMDAADMHYPIHLGVTEAGDGEDGRIKSAVGIGALLIDGLGDTIRVSLSEEPEAEIPVARKIVDYISSLADHLPITKNFVTPENQTNITIVHPQYDPMSSTRRKSRSVAGIGGNNPPAVISDRFDLYPTLKPDCFFSPETNRIQSPYGAFPLFTVSETIKNERHDADVKFISLTYNDLNDDTIQFLKTDKKTIAVVNNLHTHYVGEARAFMHRLIETDCDVPVIFRREYKDADWETVQIKAAIDFGALLTDGFGDGIMMCHVNYAAHDAQMLVNCMFNILQAARVRISKTEYISCPGCGRTMFDLQNTIQQVKAATSHLKGLKIGIMGCIVNGPGEMADADYGYVGASRGRISLYKGKTCMTKNIPEDEAVEKLLELIYNK